MRLEDQLIDNEINRENLAKLKEGFSKDFIPFIGAGSSVPLGEYNWNDLFKKMKTSLGINVRLAKDSSGQPDYPRSFSKLYRKMENKSEFFTQVFQNIEPTETSFTASHINIVESFECYVTTNYDTPIEKAYYNQKKQKIKRHFFSCYEMEDFKGGIVYLHGHKDINFAILKKEDYEYFYPSISRKNGIPILEGFLENIYKLKTIIFIGFSFQDRYLHDFFHYLASKYRDNEKTHFLLTNASDENKVKEKKFYYDFIREMKVYPIVYKEHIFIEQLLRELKIPATIPIIEEPKISPEV